MALCIPLTGRLSDRIGRRPVLWMGAGSTIVLAIPAFVLIDQGPIWTTLLGLGLLAIPVTFYVANLASALPALFPTASRYGAMGIAYNFAVAIFGGTAPLIMQGLITLTGNDMMPAYYLMVTSAIGAVAIGIMKESAKRPMPGSMPRQRWPLKRRPASWLRPRTRTRCWIWTPCRSTRPGRLEWMTASRPASPCPPPKGQWGPFSVLVRTPTGLWAEA